MHRLDHAAELLATFNFFELDDRPLGDVNLLTRRPVVSMAMWPVVVIVLCENLDQVVEVVAAKNDEVLQAFMLDRLDDSLRSGI